MCTFILAWRVFDDTPVVAAATRDESLDRPSEPPARYSDDPIVVAPRDAEAGGTWIGVNEHGLLVAVTNRWTDAELAGDRSRGSLVADALASASAAAAANLVADAVETDEYDGFYLALADSSDAIVCAWDGTLDRIDLDPGVHVLVNVGLAADPAVPSRRESVGREHAENARLVRTALAPDADDSPTDWLDRARRVMADHDYGVCRHGESYGTRSASLVSVGATTSYEYADGPPCEAPVEPVGLESHI
ncbi:NRDE family protein [Halovivax cerinus]|uniref:NRDE family protein n=1 Tax=Halovivax cerinus TaxID=1487865 RepID=A0ABD5NK69_9EURY|nr:NRDE family protein [Halovivax cerinus]